MVDHKFFRKRCGECMYGSGEGACGMTRKNYLERYYNETLENLPCLGRGIEPEITVPATSSPVLPAGPVISGFTDYRQYKAEMDRELTQAAESFVRIGWLLRVAEDTDILKESGYRNVTEFAAAEYGLDKTQVSRFINISIRFSEGGYSDRLQERYRKFGYAKLAVMLSLPDAVNEELPGSLSKSEVQAVADEIKAESAISDIELAIEQAEAAPVQQEGQEASLQYRAAAQLCREQQELFRKIWYGQDALEIMQEILVPQGEAVFLVRIPGMGRLMITVREQETAITVVRTNEKERCSTEEFVLELWKICRKGATPEEAFLQEFGEEMEKTGEAPSGQEPGPAAAVEKKEPKQRKISRVTKARIPEPAAAIKETPAAAVEGTGKAVPEERLPGQMEVYDYPEMIPEGMKEENHGAEEKEAAGGESPAVDGGTGSGAGGSGKQEPDFQEYDEIPGTAEDDGCAGDSATEEEAWMEARRTEEKLRQYFAVWDGKEQDMPEDLIQSVYRTAVDLAAAIEKAMIRRNRNHE